MPETAPDAALAAGLVAFSLYAGLLTLIGVWLTLHVGRKRGQLGISIGDGGNPKMVRAMRGQANFVESVPLALVLILATALLGAPSWVVHLLGIPLVIGRVLHALHFTADDAPGWQRGAGAGLTLLVLVLGALGVVGHAVLRLG